MPPGSHDETKYYGSINRSRKRSKNKTFLSRHNRIIVVILCLFGTCLANLMLCSFASFLALTFTLPTLPSGNAVLGNDIAVLTSKFDPSTVKEVIFRIFDIGLDTISVNFFHNLCSKVETESSHYNHSGQVNATNYNNQPQYYKIGESHVIEGSEVHYNFSASESQVSGLPCAADVYAFTNYRNYELFYAGHDVKATHTYCLNSSLTFTSPILSDSFYFVGLKAHESTIINYTTTQNVLAYNLSSFTPSTCTFLPTASSHCSISLTNYSGHQDVCIVGVLQGHRLKDYITLNYTTTKGRQLRMRETASYVLLGVFSSSPVLVICVFCGLFCCALVGKCEHRRR